MIWRSSCRNLPLNGTMIKMMGYLHLTLNPVHRKKSGRYASMAIAGNPQLTTEKKEAVAHTVPGAILYKVSMILRLYFPNSPPSGIMGRMGICCPATSLPAQTGTSGGNPLVTIVGKRLSVTEPKDMDVPIVLGDLPCQGSMIWKPFSLYFLPNGITRETST